MNKVLLSICLGCCMTVISCNAKSAPGTLADPKAGMEDSLRSGSRIDSLHQWVTGHGITEFDYKSEMLAFVNVENLPPFKVTGNDQFGLLEHIPAHDKFQYIDLVGYFSANGKYYLIVNCWDDNALHPIGYLVAVDPSFKIAAMPAYESTLDLTLDYSILKYALYDEKKGELIHFENNPGVVYDENYRGTVRYDESEIQEVLTGLTADEIRSYKGFPFKVVVSAQNKEIGQLDDTAWVKRERIKQTHCFPESYEDFVFTSSKRWYESYVKNNGVKGDDWKIELAPCK